MAYCEVTGNPCGTDTVRKGFPCGCDACQEWATTRVPPVDAAAACPGNVADTVADCVARGDCGCTDGYAMQTERDAARYRWLRDPYNVPPEDCYYGGTLKGGEKLDRAIDTAMAKEKP